MLSEYIKLSFLHLYLRRNGPPSHSQIEIDHKLQHLRPFSIMISQNRFVLLELYNFCINSIKK